MRTTHRLAWTVAAATTVFGLGAAHATILTFDVDGIFAGMGMNQDYGDSVTGLSNAEGSYGEAGEGFTGNVVVDYGTVSPALWTTSYSDLTNVLYEEVDSQGPLQITLTADATHYVTLYDFDLGSWLSSSDVPVVSVLDEFDTVLYTSTSVSVLSNVHTQFNFATPLSGQTLRIIIDQANLGAASDNIGIDNVRFGQERVTTQPVPEPATMTLLGLGIAALAARARRKQA